MKTLKKIIKDENFIMVSIITLLALLLRIIAANNYGMLWFDELYSWDYASQDSVFKTLITSVSEDVHHPIYFILLHFWIKLFGNNPETMRYLTILISIPLIPLTYIAGKNIFNKTTGYMACIFVCLCSFCAYYSVEIRFYGLVLVLSLLCTYYHTLYITDSKPKDKKLFVTFQTLLNYTFPYGILYFGALAVFGLLYSCKYNKNKLKKVIKTYSITILTSFAAIVLVLYNFIALRNNIFSYQTDNLRFSFGIILDIIENFFSASNIKIITENFSNSKAISDYFVSWPVIILVLVPMIIGVAFTIKGIITKNKKMLLFLLPSFTFIVLILFFGFFNLISVQLRYFCMVFPAIILCMCYGFSNLKNIGVSIILFIVMLQLNFVYTILQDKTIYTLHRTDNEDLGYCTNDVWNIKDDDLILAPFAGRKMYYYIKKGKVIDFSIDEAVLLKNKNSGLFYFGEDFNKLNRENIADYLINDALNDIPQKSYEQNLKKIFDKMKPGQRLFVVIFFENLLYHPYERGIDENNYKSADMLPFVIGKTLRDTVIISERNLKYLGGADNYCSVRVFEKQ